MSKEKILVIGACGQLGVELTLALRQLHGTDSVIASDMKAEHHILQGAGPFIPMNVLNREVLQHTIAN
jgi:dTDP-4-dehydrorhamnose reductase